MACENTRPPGTMVGMSQLKEHYRMLLGLDDAWQVDSVDLQLEEQMVVIRLEHRGQALMCPECGCSCSQADLAPERHGVIWTQCSSRPRATGSCATFQL